MMGNDCHDTVITINDNDQKRVISSLSVSYDNVDHTKTQTWIEFRNMSRLGIVYKNDDLLIVLDQSTFTSLSDQGIVDLWKAKRLGWFSSNYHKTKVNMQLKGNVLDKLYKENTEIIIDSFSRLRKFEVTRDAVDIIAGGIGLSYYLFGSDIDKVLSRIRIDQEQILLNDVAEDEFQWVIQLFWFWGLLDEAGQGIGSKYDIISDLYCALFGYLQNAPYDRIEFFDYLRNQCMQYPALRGSREDIEEVFNTYIVKNLSINEPNSLQKPLMDFSDLASADLDQLPNMLDRHKGTIKKTAVYLLGMKFRYHRVNSFVDHDYALYYFTKVILSCVQAVELDGNNLIASLRTDITENDGDILKQAIIFIEKRSEYIGLKLLCSKLDDEINKLRLLSVSRQEQINKEKNSINRLEVELSDKREISQSKEDEIKILKDTIKEKEAEKLEMNNRLTNLNDQFNELAVETGRLEEELRKEIKPRDNVKKTLESSEYSDKSIQVKNASPENENNQKTPESQLVEKPRKTPKSKSGTTKPKELQKSRKLDKSSTDAEEGRQEDLFSEEI